MKKRNRRKRDTERKEDRKREVKKSQEVGEVRENKRTGKKIVRSWKDEKD